MTTSKRKIEAKPFVRDLRNGKGDRELMEKYTLSENQLHKVFHKLVDAGVIDEMELFMRTSLSDSTMTRAFVGTQCTMDELGYSEENRDLPDLETPSNTSITVNVNTPNNVLKRMISKLAGTGS